MAKKRVKAIGKGPRRIKEPQVEQLVRAPVSAKKCGALIVIGGAEDKSGEQVILKEIARRVGDGILCIATVASTIGNELWDIYKKAFTDLGVKHITHLDV